MKRFALPLLALALLAQPVVATAADLFPFLQTPDRSPSQQATQVTRQQAAALTDTSRNAQQLSGVITTVEAQQGLSDLIQPFGADLFRGRFSLDITTAFDPGYIITPGDMVTIRMWGAVNQDLSQAVDIQGNVFLPGVGPVRLSGVTASTLEITVQSAVSKVFTSNVSVYANLQKPQPVAAFVAGSVVNPGRYTGSARDTAMYFIDRAGGISLPAGSFRDISVMRGDTLVDKLDLYNFLLEGRLSRLRIEDGDVILVGPKGPSVTVLGEVKKVAAYEWPPTQTSPMTGRELVVLARPLPAATHALVSGTRGSEPFQSYITLSTFLDFTLTDGDTVSYYSDALNPTIAISVKGAHTGPSVLTVKRSARLKEVLAHVPVDVETANLGGIHLLRKTVADQQKKSLQEALRRLEREVLTHSASTLEESQIRVQESQMIARFVEQAKQIQPDGLVVVSEDDQLRNIALEAGDVIMVPLQSDVVLISGEVRMPASVAYAQGRSINYYVQQAGGYTERSSRDAYVIRPSGKLELNTSHDIGPGDQIIILPAMDTKIMPAVKELTQILYQIAVGARMVDLTTK